MPMLNVNKSMPAYALMPMLCLYCNCIGVRPSLTTRSELASRSSQPIQTVGQSRKQIADAKTVKATSKVNAEASVVAGVDGSSVGSSSSSSSNNSSSSSSVDGVDKKK